MARGVNHASLSMCLAAALLALAAAAQARYPGWYMNELTTEVVTPHVAWAKPYAGGTVRGLFVVPYWYAAREVVELSQRLDLQFDAVTTCDSTHLGWDSPDRPDPYTRQVEATSPAEKETQLRGYLARPHDVIVLGNFRLESLSPELQYAILEQVKAGAGLVVTYFGGSELPLFNSPAPEAAEYILTGLPFSGMPYFAEKAKPADSLRAAHIGKGRLVTLAYPGAWSSTYYGGYGLTPLYVDGAASRKDPRGHTVGEEPRQVYYDYYQALVARAVLWAAGKASPVKVALPVADGASLTWEQARGDQRVTVAGAVPAQAKIALTVRDALGQPEFSAEQACPTGTEASVDFAWPQLSGGGHYLDAWLVGPQGTIAWASAHFTVVPPSAIAEVQVPCTRRTPADAVSGSVNLTGPRAGLRLELSLVDTYERLLARQSRTLKPGEDTIAFSLPLSKAVAHWATVWARLYDGAQLLSTQRTGVPVYAVRTDEYPIVAWATDDVGWLGLLWLRQMRELGFTGVFQYFYPEQRARADLTMTPFIGGVRFEPQSMGLSPWTDQSWREKKAQQVKDLASQFFPYGCFLYDLGDENYFRPEQMTYPSDLDSFRAFLSRKYGSLERANQVWGGAVNDWKDLKLISPDEARQSRQWPRYHDQLAHAEYLYAQTHHWYHDLIKQVDPQAQIGPEGSEMGNLEELIQGLEFCGPYNEPYYNALLRSLAPRSLWRSNWWGGYMWQRNPTQLRYQLWQWTLEGNNFVEYFATGGSEGFYAADFRIAYFYDWIHGDLEQLQHGVGTLIARSEHLHDGAALLHSQASLHLASLLPGPNSWNRAQESLIRQLDLQGLQYRYLTSGQLEAGGLEREKIRVLLLGDAMALSDAEARRLRDFVQAGGILIADTNPAIAGGNCEPLPHGALDDLFGVTQSGEPQRTAPGKLEAALKLGQADLRLSQEGMVADGAVALAGGQALGKIGETPAFILQRHGQGATFLVNCSVYSLSPENQVKLAEFLRALLAETGVIPSACVTDPDGHPIMGVRENLMRRYGVATLGVTVTPGAFPEARDARLRLRRPAHLYDLQRKRYLGRVDSLPLRLEPGGVYLFALLPYQVDQVDLEAPAEVGPGAGIPLTVRVSTTAGAQPGHVLWLRVTGPDGRERAFYERLLTMDQPEVHLTVPLAENDAPGDWRLTVRDASTGRGASRVVRVHPPG